MCGFSGFYSIDPSNESQRYAQRMGDAIAHRGPDDAGEWCDPDAGIFFAFRRLSILDLSPQGHQPIHSAEGRWALCFNGEIYNYETLRQDLLALGFTFRGTSDSEVLVQALSAWGLAETLLRLNGMFALAAWDRETRSLYLARDRAGEKPLYYGWNRSSFLFGSELKALRAHPEFNGAIDPGAVAEFMQLSCVPAPLSIYQSVAKLLPGHYLRLSTARNTKTTPEVVCYWSALDAHRQAQADPVPETYREQCDRLDHLLSDAVGIRMRSDVPLGAFLSGGIDSSLIVSMMQERTARPIQTFTIAFKELDFDESTYARSIAERLGTHHTEIYVQDSEARELIPKLPHIYDEPFADASQIPTYFVSRLARESVTVSLSGDGGDELFGGYPRYRSIRRMAPAWDYLPRFAKVGFDELLKRIPTKLRSRLLGNILSKKLSRLSGTLLTEDAGLLYRALMCQWRDGEAMKHSSQLRFESRFAASPSGDLVERMMWYDFVHYLGDDVLAKLDRASMAVSLEARVPFLDPRVIDYAWRLPVSSKLSGPGGKRILRDVLARRIPRELFERPKMGFSVPIGSWLRTSLHPWAESLLAPKSLNTQGFFDAKKIGQIWKQHLEGTADHSAKLWNVLMFQSWFESTARKVGK